MDNLFLFLMMLSLGSLIVALVKPSAFQKIFKDKSTRKELSLYFSGATILFFILFGITVEPIEQNTKDTVDNTLTEESEENIPQELTEEEKIRTLVQNVLKGKNNMGLEYIRKIEVVKQVSDGWDVFTEFNANDNLTTNLQKKGIESKMAEIYIALYASNYDVRYASVNAYFPLTDKYGNKSSDVVYKSTLDKKEADKVNWDADETSLKINILPGI